MSGLGRLPKERTSRAWLARKREYASEEKEKGTQINFAF